MGSVMEKLEMEKNRTQAREEFRAMRFGLFVHWGVYSILGRGEWVMHNEKIPVPEYEKLPPQFNPVKFNAREWVSLVKEAGMKYITITSKHHDGFCMYDSDLTDYKVTNTPYKRDPIDSLAKECHRRGVKLLFYYSPLDWHHPAYQNDWDAYTRYWHGQVLELFRKYKPAGIWLDGCWNKPEKMDETWKLTELYREIRKLSPGAIIANNHHQKPLPDEDIQTFEQDLPGENRAGFNTAMPHEGALFETCLTMNNSWGYHANDHNHKSLESLIRTLATCAGLDANLLLNVGPKPDGTIQPEFVERLQGMGAWLKRNGESVYGTRGRVFGQTPWGAATRTEKALYFHLWKLPEVGGLSAEMPGVKVRSARLLATRRSVNYTQFGSQLRFELPAPLPDPADTVLKVEIS